MIRDLIEPIVAILLSFIVYKMWEVVIIGFKEGKVYNSLSAGRILYKIRNNIDPYFYREKNPGKFWAVLILILIPTLIFTIGIIAILVTAIIKAI